MSLCVWATPFPVDCRGRCAFHNWARSRLFGNVYSIETFFPFEQRINTQWEYFKVSK